MGKPPKHRSFSQIETYLNCPKKYEFRYIIKPSIVGVNEALVIGGCGHDALAKILLAKMNGKDIGPKKRAQIIQKAVREAIEKLRVSEAEMAEATGIPVALPIKQWTTELSTLLNLWCKDLLPELDPTAVEMRIDWEIEGVPFVGYVDLVHKERRVIDWKFSRSAKSMRDVENSLQLATYADVMDLPEIGFGSLVRPKRGKEAGWKPKVVINHCPILKSQKNWAREVIMGALNGIDRGYFPVCDPSNFLCSELYCECWPICRGREKREQTPGWMDF